MERELAHSFNIRLEKEIAHRLKSEQSKLSKEFSERRFYDPSPHLSIATKFMDEGTTPAFVGALMGEFNNDVSWELEFTDFRPSETGDYIFLHLSDGSRSKLFELHERAFRATKGIGLEVQTGKKFRHFAYDPHISIIKLRPEEVARALTILNKDFSGVKMSVAHYEITRQQDDEKGFSNFPVIQEINLK